ncbi:putative 20S rRNA accumulation protein 4 [Lachnellula cervina]|uniref:Putative 20S rRNA accumulation protein 4 n=1 Tax=Lachnellula cervina TaxID=1316786 RepID=A0A7D8URJ7_9HELO|nr:putative 20S rRNA accumulation protein 4 [Lachnellula cervina]
MAPYESDSSGGEDNDYTETNVLLGYASKEPSDDTISHIGGRPEWLDPSTPPSAALARCKVCNDLMALLLQLNGDLPEHFPGHERRLYVLACRRKTCRRKEGSIRALRGTKISKVAPKEKSAPAVVSSAPKPVGNTGIGETLFGAKPSANSASANPFSIGTSSPSNPFSTSSPAPQNPFATNVLPPTSGLVAEPPQESSGDITASLPKTFASALSLNSPKPSTFGPPPIPEPWPSDSSQPPAYPLYYLVDADYEILDKAEEAPIPTPTMDLDDSSAAGGGKEDKEVFESILDKTFQKFADRLAQNPEQVIRYEFKGSPLLSSKTDAIGKLLSSSAGNEKVRTTGGSASGIPRCGNCGMGRVFEVQLTPHAIMELERDEDGIDGMEWGTIVVGVCERDCVPNSVGTGEVGYLEEWAGVQWEELDTRR